MKTYISIFLIFSFLTIKAQEIIVPLEDELTYEDNTETPIYFKDVNNTLNKFTGNWVFDDGTHYLKIFIVKNSHEALGWPPHYNDPNFNDNLSITLIYKLNGVEIYNTESASSQDAHITGSIINNSNEIEFYYREPTTSCERHKKADLSLEFISDGTLGQNGSLPSGTLEWKRVNGLSRVSPLKECPDGNTIDTSEFVIPAELTLERE